MSWSWFPLMKMKCSANENEGECLEDHLNQVNDSPLWVLVRDYLTPADILVMRTTGLKWN